MKLASALALVLLCACSSGGPACGPGTVLSNGLCLVADGGSDGGKPDAGRCVQGTYQCGGGHTGRQCFDGGWVDFPCRGPEGCTADGGVLRCDFNGTFEGDTCPTGAIGGGVCTVDGKGTLECRSDGGVPAFLKTNVCQSCVQNGTMVVCTP
jgi:hypothetical protein